MGKPIFKVEISNGSPNGYETATVMEMPATWAEFNDALQKARIKDGRSCKNELTCIRCEALRRGMIGDHVNLYDLNLFAQRLATLTEEQRPGMEALLKMEQEQYSGPIPLERLINLTYQSTRSRSSQRNEQWRKFIDYLYGRDIELQTFDPVEIRGIRPLREGDLTFPEEIILSGHCLNFQFDFVSAEAQREVLGAALDHPSEGSWLDILCNYDVARQEIDHSLSLTLYNRDGAVRQSFSYPLGKEERALLWKQMEVDCLCRTGKTLNDYYARLDLERESPPELTAGTKRLPADAVSFADEISECDGKLNFYIPINFDPDAVFGTNVASAFNDDWLNVYASFDWKTGRLDSALAVYLVCADGHEFAFSYPLTPAEQVQLWEKMDAYCRQQTGQGLEDTRAALLREQREDTPEIQM